MNEQMPPPEIELHILSGHSDLQGLCLALSDWNAELRLIEKEL
jgi:hypothetical protein